MQYQLQDSKITVSEDETGSVNIRVENSTDPAKYDYVCIIKNLETGEKMYLNKISISLLALALAKLKVQEATDLVNKIVYKDIDIHKIIDDRIAEVEDGKQRKLNPALLEYIKERLHEYYDVIESQREYCDAYEIPPATFSYWLHRYNLQDKAQIDKHAKLTKRHLQVERLVNGSVKNSYKVLLGKRKSRVWFSNRRQRSGLFR